MPSKEKVLPHCCQAIRPLRVTFYQRRPRTFGNTSLEFIFSDIRQRLKSEIESTVRIAPCESNGIVPRMKIMLDAWRNQGDITHVTGDINFAAIMLRSSRLVLTVLDCGDLVARRDLAKYILKFFWFNLPSRKARVITTISEASKADIVALTGISPGKVEVIPVAISDNFRRCDKEFNASKPRILQVGTAVNKNLERTATALHNISCTFVVVGKLSDGQRDVLCNNGIAYENHTNLTEAEIIRLYETADIVSFASTVEGFGMPIVEAQVVGRAVLTSHCSSMPEVAGDAACFVDPLDIADIRRGFLRLLNDCNYREKLICDGFKNASRFNGVRIAQQYLEIYRSLNRLN